LNLEYLLSVDLFEQLAELAVKQEDFEEAKIAFEAAINIAERIDADTSSIAEKLAALPTDF
jgi:uncharacterized protein HemY